MTDGLSEGRLMEKIFAAYEGKLIEREEYTFYDYSLESSAGEGDEIYFKNLIGDTEATVYPRSRDAAGEGRSRTVSIELEKNAVEKERRNQGVTASSYILHSLMQVLRCITREERVLIAAENNGRSYGCMQACQDFFVKTLPVLSEDSAAELQSQFIHSISHEEYPLSAEYDDSLYTEKDMLTLLTCVRTMATTGRLVTEDEERQLIALSAGETLDYDISKTFIDLFIRQAHQTPDNMAEYTSFSFDASISDFYLELLES